RSHGIEPTHIDGHGHCHMQPKLVPIVARIARHYGIRWARMPSEAIFYPGRPSRLVQKCLLNLLCRRGARLMSGDLRFPDRFFGFSDGGNLGLPSLNRILGRVSPGLNELMCHVGTGHDDPPFHIGYNWSRELETLTHYTKQQLLTGFGIE